MKKYNRSEIMKKAWEMKKSYNYRSLSFGECLKRAWKQAKNACEEAAMRGIKFENHMDITVEGYTRELVRWTKGGNDRIYINGGSKAGEGYVDIKTGFVNLYSKNTYAKKMAEIILSMEF